MQIMQIVALQTTFHFEAKTKYLYSLCCAKVCSE